jgi:hypothetical protein
MSGTVIWTWSSASTSSARSTCSPILDGSGHWPVAAARSRGGGRPTGDPMGCATCLPPTTWRGTSCMGISVGAASRRVPQLLTVPAEAVSTDRPDRDRAGQLQPAPVPPPMIRGSAGGGSQQCRAGLHPDQRQPPAAVCRIPLGGQVPDPTDQLQPSSNALLRGRSVACHSRDAYQGQGPTAERKSALGPAVPAARLPPARPCPAGAEQSVSGQKRVRPHRAPRLRRRRRLPARWSGGLSQAGR